MFCVTLTRIMAALHESDSLLSLPPQNDPSHSEARKVHDDYHPDRISDSELNKEVPNTAPCPMTNTQSLCKTDSPHVFDLYMFADHFISPGHFKLSTSAKWHFDRMMDRHKIPKKHIEEEIDGLNQMVLWYLMLPKLLWIVPWLCLPIGVVVYAVEDGFAFSHPDASDEELQRHLRWSYDGLFLFVGGGIGGVLLSTQLWNHCWYRCITAMAERINELNLDPLWAEKYGVHFDIQCDIPVLAGRSYGRAYYKIVIAVHHEETVDNERGYEQMDKEPNEAQSVDADLNETEIIDSMDMKESADKSRSNDLERTSSYHRRASSTMKDTVFNPSGFVSRSVMDKKSLRSKLRESRLSHHDVEDDGESLSFGAD